MFQEGDFDNDRFKGMPKAQFLGTCAGKKVYKVPVRVVLNDSYRCFTEAVYTGWVTACSARDAVAAVREVFHDRAETEVYAWGPKGGVERSYVSWNAAIGQGLRDLWTRGRDRLRSQLEFNLEEIKDAH